MGEDRGTWNRSADQEASRKPAQSADSDEPEALFARAVRLQREGQETEARAAIVELAEMYEARGQHTQALRIRRMLGDPSMEGPGDAGASQPAVAAKEPLAANATGAGVDTAQPGAQHDVAPAMAPARNTVPAPARSQTTGSLATRTWDLPERSTALLRTASLANPNLLRRTAPRNPFRPGSLTFTIPLPGEAGLPENLRQMVVEAGQHLQAGRIDAALDGCLQLLTLDGSYAPNSVRIAEILTVQRRTGRARAEAETVLRLMETTGQREQRWMPERVLLHTDGQDSTALQALIQHLIEARQLTLASFYASRQIRLLDDNGLTDEAWASAVRLSDQLPGDPRIMVEHVVLCLKAGDPDAARARLDAAFAAGTDPAAVQLARAVMVAASDEEFHWRELAEVLPLARADPDRAERYLDAYARLAEAMPADPVLEVGHGLVQSIASPDPAASISQPATMVTSPRATPMTQAVAAVTVAQIQGGGDATEERVEALRTALRVLGIAGVADHPAWIGLIGALPRTEDISLDLGDELLERGDVDGAIEVLEIAQQGSPRHEILCQRLADAYFQSGRLRDALAVLDALASQFRAEGQLEQMAGILRRMAEMAPNNAKVKGYLIDAYLQRGFVAEARVELIELAGLDQRAGRITRAASNLKRAADLDWTIGLAEQAFALYEQLVALMPDQIEHRYALVALYLQMGRTADAAIHQRAIADSCLAAGRTREAIAALQQLIGLTPTDVRTYQELSQTLRLVGEDEQSDRVAQRITAITKNDAAAARPSRDDDYPAHPSA